MRSLLLPTRWLPLVAGALLLGHGAAIALDAQTPGYTITDLGTLGGVYSIANGINNAGQVVGWSYTTGNSATHAALFTFNGTTVTRLDLGGLSTSYNSAANGINDAGQIVGTAGVYANGGSVSHATLFTVAGTAVTATDLGTLGGNTSEALGINNLGQVIGDSDVAAGSSTSHAALFAVSGATITRTDLGTFGGDNSVARSITAAGLIAGDGYTSGSGIYHAGLFAVNGATVTRTDLGTLPGGNFCFAWRMNSAGQIACQSNSAASSSTHPALFTVNGTTVTRTDLGVLPSGTGGAANSINEAGQIVGWSDVDSAGTQHIFIYTATAGMLDLNTLLGSNPIATGIATEKAGNILNDWGQIAAVGSVNGATHALLLNPTTPISTRAGTTQDTRLVTGMSYSLTPAYVTSTNSATATTLSLLGGTAGSGGSAGVYRFNREVTSALANNSSSAPVAGDAVDLEGTAADLVVVQLGYPADRAVTLFGTETNARLGWYNGTRWINAVDGNVGGSGRFAGFRAYNAATDFKLGTYGVDPTNHTAWAAVNHGGVFGVMIDPEALRKIKTVGWSGTRVTLTLDGFTGHAYQLQRAVNLTNGDSGFVNVETPVTGSTGTTLSLTHDEGVAAQTFYRITVGP